MVIRPPKRAPAKGSISNRFWAYAPETIVINRTPGKSVYAITSFPFSLRLRFSELLGRASASGDAHSQKCNDSTTTPSGWIPPGRLDNVNTRLLIPSHALPPTFLCLCARKAPTPSPVFVQVFILRELHV